ncbi:MAG: hypothetical protein FWF77_05115 [Defluviitaleaceae bacterium]|nr:hypothetical protein [Defluviitaleaceae bacterium]
MKNKFVTLAAVLMFAAATLLLTACNGGNEPPAPATPAPPAENVETPAQDPAPPVQDPAPAQPAAVSQAAGIWMTTMETDIGYGHAVYHVFTTLNEDGSGFEEYVWIEDGEIYLTMAFTWSAADGVITYHIPGVGDVSSEYSVTGNLLTMVGEAGTFIYERVDPQDLIEAFGTAFSDAVGVWATTMNTDIGYGVFEYHVVTSLYADGTGFEEYVWVEDGQVYLSVEFTWTAVDGVITYHMPGGDSFSSEYTVVGDILTMVGELGTFVYARVE